jgi:hypothetical protein
MGKGDFGKSKGLCGAPRKTTEFRVDMINNEYKVLSKLSGDTGGISASDWPRPP